MAQHSPESDSTTIIAPIAAHDCRDRMHAEDQYILEIERDLLLQRPSNGASDSGSSNSSACAAACTALSSQTQRLVDETDILEDEEDEDMEISMAAAATPQDNPQRLCKRADISNSRAPVGRPASAGALLYSPDKRSAGEGALEGEEDDQEESGMSAAATPRQHTSGRHRRARSSGSPSEDNLSMTGLMDSDSEGASHPSQSGKDVRSPCNIHVKLLSINISVSHKSKVSRT